MRSIARTLLVASTVIVTSVALAAPASAHNGGSRTVRPGQSIQAAVDAARPGDTVVVLRGTYREQVRVSTNRVALRARGAVTIRPPSGGGRCDVIAPTGICVLPRDLNTETMAYGSRVSGVSIRGFRIVGFGAFGVFAFGSQGLKVSRVHAVDNGVYGIARFDSNDGYIRDSSATGSDEAGLYVGDSPSSHALVEHNRAWNNGYGIFVRHVHLATVRHNTVWANCLGMFFLDDGQPEGNGDNRISRNTVRDNNRVCPASDEAPALSGGGIVLYGSQRNRVERNTVTGNRGATIASGGIVLLTATLTSGKGSNNNVVTRNRAARNAPADLVQGAGSTGNTFRRNRCATSIPAGLCRR
ncbi:MAG TPA: right-handed parallel beta-helix repeat-containing protein [Actinomycetales bacterium]|nr:right-handed parallel beta-helix repeat-containing protein [Actinomycetales bacterium]